MPRTRSADTLDPHQAAAALQRRPLSELKPWDRNYNKGNVDAIRTSIARFGMNGALRVWQDDIVIAGNHALHALRAMHDAGELPPTHVTLTEDGDWLVPVLDVAHLPKLEAEAFAIADNRTRDLATTDDEQLAALLREIADADEDLLAATGYDHDDLAALLDQLGDLERPDVDAEPRIDEAEVLRETWKTEPGQLWILGDHRLIIGDARQPATYRALLSDGLASCLWTDPPYGVNYVGGTASAMTIQGDDPAGLAELLTSAFSAIDASLEPGAALYVAHPAGGQSLTFFAAFNAAGWSLRQGLVWVKDALVLGHSDYHYRHEPIIYGIKPAPGRRGRGGEGWYGGNDQTTVFEIPRPRRNEEHPTIKPTELVAAMLINSTRPGAVVLDPFVGSGTTLLACEQLGRRCRAVEIDPGFAAVTLQRWVDATEGTPRLEESPA